MSYEEQLYIIPISTGETATMFIGEDAKKIMKYEKGQTYFTSSQLDELYAGWDDSKERQELFKLLSIDDKKAIIFLDEEYLNGNEELIHFQEGYYQFDKLCIVDDKTYTSLNKVSDELWKSCGGDSSTYAACNAFGVMCIEFAITVINI